MIFQYIQTYVFFLEGTFKCQIRQPYCLDSIRTSALRLYPLPIIAWMSLILLFSSALPFSITLVVLAGFR